jgi:hypothetical protein
MVAIYIREGAKRASKGGVFNEVTHFWDHVGRSLSRMRVYTAKPRFVPTTRSPDLLSRVVTVWFWGRMRDEWIRHVSFCTPDKDQVAIREPIAAIISFMPESTDIHEMLSEVEFEPGKTCQKARTRRSARFRASRITTASTEEYNKRVSWGRARWWKPEDGEPGWAWCKSSMENLLGEAPVID